MIRKRLVFILTNKVNEALGYIISNIPDDIKFDYRREDNSWCIFINGYNINIRSHIGQNARGYRPEIVYIMNDFEIDKDIYENVIEPKVLLSVRKEPIRYIKSAEYIHVDELLKDDYAEYIHCDKEKVEYWTDLKKKDYSMAYDEGKWKQEYECVFIGKEK